MKDSQVATINQPTSLIQRFAGRYFVDADKLLTTLKATAFKQKANGPEVTNEQMMALLVVADQYRLNPFTKEIFAYPDKGGIVPVVGVDGWSRIINENPQLDGIAFTYSEKTVEHKGKTCHQWIECHIQRKDRANPITVREYFSEVVRELEYKTPWDTHPNRMHRHKTLIQCARIAFGFAGIYDEDEAERVIEMGAIEVPAKITPNAGAGDELTAAQKQVVQDTAALIRKAFTEGREPDAYMYSASLTELGDQLYLWSLLNSKERAAIKRMQQAERKANAGGTVDAEFVADIEAEESRPA